MGKLFIFAIGGTGSRVLRALTMLLASGIKTPTSQIVPIIIDPDNSNEDLTRTIDAMNKYNAIENSLKHEEGKKGFFHQEIQNIFSEQNPFRMPFTGVEGKKFKHYIDYGTLETENKAMADMLFSQVHLDLDMQVGFKGNPNLGSVVLNQFGNNKGFQEFALNFAQGDRIFIISSIHGGTGAAGFPLLLKNILKASSNVANNELIKNSFIGALTVLPYFKLQNGEIKSEDFISKSKAALEYYAGNVNKSLNSLYYVGYKDHTKSYDNNPGGTNQKNPAHFVELASALAVIDFMKQSDQAIKEKDKRFMEFGVESIDTKMKFQNLDDTAIKEIRKPLSQYMFFSKYLDLQIEKSINKQPWGIRGSEKIAIGKDFIYSDFFNSIQKFNNHFKEWLNELSENSPAFIPFNMGANEDNLTEMINGHPIAKKSMFKDNFILFDHYLNGCERMANVAKIPVNEKFMSLFYIATDQLLSKNFKI